MPQSCSVLLQQLEVPLIAIYNRSHFVNGIVLQAEPWLYQIVHSGAPK